MCRLTRQKILLLPTELTADDAADLTTAYHLPNLMHTGPLCIVCFAGQENDFLQRSLPLQAVEIKVGIAVTAGTQQFKLFFIGAEAGLFKQLPCDGLTAVFTCFGGTAGVFPCSREALSRRTAGQKQIALAVLDPDTDDQTVFSCFPAGSTAVNPTGQVPVFIVDIIKFQGVHLPRQSYFLILPQESGNGNSVSNFSLSFNIFRILL